MDEEEKKTEEGKENPDKTEEGGVQSETTPLLDIANAAAERMEKANVETARLQDKQDAIDARKALGGRAEAGQQAPEKVPETDDEFLGRLEKGEVDLAE